MRRKIVYSRRADLDLDRLEAFIASESRPRAARAIERILTGLQSLCDFPELGTDIGNGYRRHILRHGKSGYVIHYRVVDGVILILRIWHAKENRPR